MVSRPAFLAIPNRLAAAGEIISVSAQNRTVSATAITPILNKASVIVQKQPDGGYIAIDLTSARSTGKRKDITTRKPVRREEEVGVYPFKGGVIFTSGKLYKGGDNAIEFVGDPATEIIAFANLGTDPKDFLVAWRAGDALIVNNEVPVADWFLKAYSEDPQYKGSDVTGNVYTFFRDTSFYEDEDPITGYGNFTWTKTRTELPFDDDISPVDIPTTSFLLTGTKNATLTQIDERPTSPPGGDVGIISYNLGQTMVTNCSYQIDSNRTSPIIAANLGQIVDGLLTETYTLSITTNETFNSLATAYKRAVFGGEFWRWRDCSPNGSTSRPNYWTNDHNSTVTSSGSRTGSASYDQTHSEYLNRTQTALNFVRWNKTFSGTFTRDWTWSANCWEFTSGNIFWGRPLIAKVPDQTQSYSDSYSLDDSWDWSAQIHYVLVSGDRCRIETIPGTGSGTATIEETANWKHVNGDGVMTVPGSSTMYVDPYGSTHNVRVSPNPVAAWEYQPPFFDGDFSFNSAQFWIPLQRTIAVQTSHYLDISEPNSNTTATATRGIPDGIRLFDEETQTIIELDENSAAFVVFDLPFASADVGDSISLNLPLPDRQIGAFPEYNHGVQYYEVALDYIYTETVTETGSEFEIDAVNSYRSDTKFTQFWDEWDNHQWVLLWKKNGQILLSNLSINIVIQDGAALQYKTRNIGSVTANILDATPINTTILYVEDRIYPGTLDDGYAAILTSNNWLSYILLMARKGWLKNSNLFIKNGIPTIATASQPKNPEIATDRTMYAELLELINGKWVRKEVEGDVTSMPLGTPINNSWWGYYG